MPGESAAPEVAVDPYVQEAPTEARPLPEQLVTTLLATAAAAWIGLTAWRAALAFAAGRPALSDLLRGAETLSAPLALIGVAYLLLRRTSRREARRFADTSAAMRSEAASLEQVLASLSDRIEENRRALGDHAHQLLLLGDDAAMRMAEISGAMRAETAQIARQSDLLEKSAAAARADMGVLLHDLPRASGEAREMARLLKETGLGAHEQAAALDATLVSITQSGRIAEEVTGGAAQRLAAHLARIQGASDLASERLDAAAGQMTGSVEAALASATDAVDEVRQAIGTQNAAMLAMVEHGRAAFERAGAESAQALAQRLEAIDARLERIASRLASEDAAGRALVEKLESGLAGVEERFARLGETGQERTSGLTEAVVTLGARAEIVDTTLARGVDSADVLVGRAETLVALLRAGEAQIAGQLPAALDALERRVNDSHAALGALVPQAEALARAAADANGKLGNADALLLRQATTIRALGIAAEERLTAMQEHADSFGAAIAASGEQVRQLVDSSGPQLVEALLRVRETAIQAAERAREAFSAVIPEAALSLAQAAHGALESAIDSGLAAQMAEVAATGEQAVQATQRATERLMRQMLTIADTTAVIETRIAEAKAEHERSDEDGFGRRVALLIEALNSTAINVTAMLSRDVADGAWAAYLKGDRGVFTRRAVRLLDSSEIREVQRLYEGDPGFREQLNRYVHDFEAMLRRVLSSRDGSPLGITLLSSDMGKLYVALAQAIERLRA